MHAVPTIISPDCAPSRCLSSGSETSVTVFAKSVHGSSSDIVDTVGFSVSIGNSTESAEYSVNSEISGVLSHSFQVVAAYGERIEWSVSAVSKSGARTSSSGVVVLNDSGRADSRIFVGHRRAFMSVIQTEDFINENNITGLHDAD